MQAVNNRIAISLLLLTEIYSVNQLVKHTIMKRNHYVSKLIPRLFILLLIGSVAFGTGGCKSKKKLAQEQAAKEYQEKVDKAIAELKAILNDDGTMPLSEKERRLADIKSQNLNDPTVNDLIRQVEDKIAAEKEALRLKEEEEARKKKEAEEEDSYQYIDEYSNAIATANSVSEANAKIGQALKLFASPDVPVLVIISQEGETVDYDEPTTIDKYLNYLKDTKNYNNRIQNIKFDDYGQITVLELIKK